MIIPCKINVEGTEDDGTYHSYRQDLRPDRLPFAEADGVIAHAVTLR
jgi:hypothetical protein